MGKTKTQPVQSEERMERKVTVTIPRTGLETEGVYVAVNGRTFNVPVGMPVEVPEPVAELLKRKNDNTEIMYGYIVHNQGTHMEGTV